MTYFRRTSFNDDARPRPQQTSMARRALASEQADATPLAVPVAASSDQWERQWGLESAQRVSTAEAAQGLINALIDVSARGSRNALKVRRARPETYRPTAKQWERWLDEPRRLIASWSSQARSAASCLGPHRPELRAALLELADRAQLLEDGYTEALRALARGVAPSGLEPGLQTEASNLHRALGQPVPHQDRLLQGPQELLRLRQRIAEELGPPKVAAARKTQATQGNIRALEAVNALSQLDVLTEMRSALEAAQKEHPRGVPPEVYLRGQSKNFEQLRQVETQLRALVPEFPRHRGMRAALEEAAGLAASIEPSYRAAAEAAWGRKNTLELDAPGAPRYARTIYTQMAETRRVMADTFPLALANQELQRQLGELRAWSEAARAQPQRQVRPPRDVPADLRLRLQTRDRLARVLDLSERLARSSTAPASQVAALRASIFATAHLYEQATREGSPYAFERLVQSVEQHALSAQKLWETARMSTPQRSRTLHLENERRRMEGLPSFAAEPLEDITGSRYAVLDVPAVESWQDFAEVAQAKHADQLAALHQTDGTTLDIRPMGLLPELARTDAPPLRWSEPAEPAQPTALGQEQMHGLKTLAQLETTDERNLVERMTALLEGATGSGELNHSLHQLGELRPGPRKMLVPRSGPLTRRYALALCSPAARKSLELRAEMGRVSAELVALAEASEDPQRVALAEQLHGLLSNPGAAASAMLADFQRFDAGHGLPPSLTEDGSAHHYAPAAARFEAGAVKNALEQLRAGYQGLRWFPPAEVRPQPPEVEVAEARLEAALARITALPPNDTGVVGLEDDWMERFGSEVADARSNYAEARSLGDPLALARFTRDAENLERISELLDLTRRADIAAVPL